VIDVLVILLHIIASLILIAVVLLQTGKRADLAGAFGGGGSQTAFGARGAATLLSKATTTMAVLFMITSLTLSIRSSSGAAGGSVLEEVETQTQTETAPVPSDEQGAAAPIVPPADTIDEGADAAGTETEGDASN